MIFQFGNSSVEISEDSFMQIPTHWVMNLSGDDLKRACLLRWRFTFFADTGLFPDASLCFYESQQSLCDLFGMSKSSRTKVSACLKRLEAAGVIFIRRGKSRESGELKPRHYIVPNDSLLIEKYGIRPDLWDDKEIIEK
ncbi:hypothetical protein [Salmonella phage SSBI34]|nr:hypothetical protein [Salmonella phage SSBI34]